MKNILSFVNRPLLGKEIKEWIYFHTEYDTEYSKIARRMLRYLNLNEQSEYILEITPKGTGCGEKRHGYPNVVKKNR